MTAQINDTLLFEGTEYRLGRESGTLFRPSEYGLRPVCLCTACRRGYKAHFAIEDGHLYLEGLEVDLNSPLVKGHVQAPPINGSLPIDSTIEDVGSMFEFVYRGLHIPVNQTGPLIIRTDEITELVHYWGFQPNATFRTVLELTFKDGHLLTLKDLSAQYAEERNSEDFSPNLLF